MQGILADLPIDGNLAGEAATGIVSCDPILFSVVLELPRYHQSTGKLAIVLPATDLFGHLFGG